MRFTQPWMLLLILPVLGGLIYSWRYLHGMTAFRKRLAIGARAVVGVLLVLALAGTEIRRPNVGLCTVFILDRSDSIKESDRKKQEEFVKSALGSMRPDDEIAVVSFGGSAAIESLPGGGRQMPRLLARIEGSATNLAGALRLASATFPPGKGKRIVLLSDGNETSGDGLGAAEAAAVDGVQIDTVSLGQKVNQGEALIAGIEAPDSAREGQPIDVRVLVDSNSTMAGVLQLERDGVVVQRRTVNLREGSNAFVFSDKLSRSGFARYRASLEAGKDTDIRNNLGSTFVRVDGKPRVLVIQEDPRELTLAKALRAKSISPDVVGPTGIPTRAESLQSYEAVILNDVNAMHFTPQQMRLIVSAAKDAGIGLAMVGGENSFLPGGWYGSPIAEALPVDLNIRQRKSMAAVSVCIIADASGSMGATEDGITKIRMAAKAAEETIKMLAPMDRVGVAGSSDGIEFVAPMQSLENKESVIAAARKLDVTGGGIYIRPSIKRAEEVLEKEPSKVRHFILLADGDDSTDWETAYETASRMRVNKITTSVVSIGRGKDTDALKRLAAVGGGRFYLAERVSKLPAIFTQDTSLMARSAIEDGAFLPKITQDDEIIAGNVGSGSPPLLAYCLVEPRALARTILKTHKDDVLLVTGQNGLASTLAFMSDAHPRWASEWVGWAGYADFWAQSVRSISRRVTRNSYQVRVAQNQGKGLVTVRAADSLGNPIDASGATLRVALPNGESVELTPNQVGPGEYQASFDADKLGSYIVTVAEKAPDGRSLVQSSGFSVPYPPEYRMTRPNRPLLEQVAKVTGGEELKEPKQAARPLSNPGVSISELWPLLVSIACGLFLLDIALRRIAVPIPELFAKVRQDLREKRGPSAATAAAPIATLSAAKDRSRSKQSQRASSSVSAPPVEKRPTERAATSFGNAVETPSQPEKDAADSSTAGALLAAKKRRKTGNE